MGLVGGGSAVLEVALKQKIGHARRQQRLYRNDTHNIVLKPSTLQILFSH